MTNFKFFSSSGLNPVLIVVKGIGRFVFVNDLVDEID